MCQTKIPPVPPLQKGGTQRCRVSLQPYKNSVPCIPAFIGVFAAVSKAGAFFRATG